MKIGLLINKETNNLISRLAKKMGTSKRNVIAIALYDIFENEITKEKMDDLMNSISLNYPTTFTANEHLKNKLDGIDRFNLSMRVFLGYLLCDHFHRHYTNLLDDVETDIDLGRDYIQASIDKTIKNKITSYCDKNAISINSLFVHFILNKNLTERHYEIINKDTLLLTFSNEVKNTIAHNAAVMSINYRTYLNLISVQICKELNL